MPLAKHAASSVDDGIQKFEPVTVSWPTYKIKFFKNGTFDNYAKARLKAKAAEDTSDLQSDVEGLNKTKRKPKTFSSSEEGDYYDEESIEGPAGYNKGTSARKCEKVLSTCYTRLEN